MNVLLVRAVIALRYVTAKIINFMYSPEVTIIISSFFLVIFPIPVTILYAHVKYSPFSIEQYIDFSIT